MPLLATMKPELTKSGEFLSRHRSCVQAVSLFLGVEGQLSQGRSWDCDRRCACVLAYEKAAMRFDVTEELGSFHPT